MKPKLTSADPAQIFTEQDESRQSFGAIHNLRQIRFTSTFTIYPISELSALITKLKMIENEDIDSDDEDRNCKVRLRYLVDVNFNLWFAQEGAATRKIPAHYQMTGEKSSDARCVLAGNIEFSEDYQTITMINHKSGDFRPDFKAMKWILAILIANEAILPAELAAELCVEHSDSSGGIMKRYSCKLPELISWANETFNPQQMSLFQEQPTAATLTQ